MEKVIILAGSESDKWHTDKIQDSLTEQWIKSEAFFKSAHKDPRWVLERVESYKDEKVIFITVAGRSNALSWVVSANTKKPVLACPPFRDKTDFMVNINSTLQMPSKTPALTVLEPSNAAMACKYIFSL